MFRTMGQRTTINPLEREAPAAQRRLVHLGIDVPMLLVVITLLIVGLVMVYSASYDYSLRWYGDSGQIFMRQAMFLVISLAVAVVLTLIDYHIWQRIVVIAMAITVFMLLAVLVVSEVRNGAVRTLMGGSVQPSELAKLVTVLYLAVWLYAKRDVLSDATFGLIPLGGILGLLGGLIFIQPDLSAVITILFLGGTMFFLAGGDLKQIGLLAVMALVVGWAVVTISSTGSERVGSYMAGLKDPTMASYHVQRAMEAFVKGKWLGVGIGMGKTKLTGLPVPQTDSIFAVMGEETGVLGASLVTGLYALLLWRGLSIARRAPDALGALMAGGLSLWLAIEAFINMAVMVNLLPFAGNALPFVSAGGSNLFVSLAAVGILLNISRKSVQVQENEDWRAFGAVINLRWRDRRRRVPRSRRTVGAPTER